MQKEIIIKKIQTIVSNYGSFSVSDVEYEGTGIMLNEINKDHVVMIEKIDSNDVDTIEYVHDIETSKNSIQFEDLSEEILEEILTLAQNYETNQEKDFDRCSD